MWKGFASAHTPAIEGLLHGGMAQSLRRQLTAFGSGWRGIVWAPPGSMGTMSGVTIPHDTLDDLVKSVRQNAAYNPNPDLERWLQDLTGLQAWSKKTGYSPVVMSRETPRSMLREYIRHERIHSAHFASPKATFWDEQFAKTGGNLRLHITKTIRRFVRKDPRGFAEQQMAGLTGFFDNPEIKTVLQKVVARDLGAQRAVVLESAYGTYLMYQQQAAALEAAKSPIKSDVTETIAWANQNNRKFFQELRGAGLKDPRALALNPKRIVRTPLALPKAVMRSGEAVHQASSWRRLLNVVSSSLRMSRGV